MLKGIWKSYIMVKNKTIIGLKLIYNIVTIIYIVLLKIRL